MLYDGRSHLDQASHRQVAVPIQPAHRGERHAHQHGALREYSSHGDVAFGRYARWKQNELDYDDGAEDGAVGGEEHVGDGDLRREAGVFYVGWRDGGDGVGDTGEDGVRVEADDVDGDKVGGEACCGATTEDKEDLRPEGG